jgi:hypothetical protein
MPTEKEPREQPAEPRRNEPGSGDSMSLVDYFDQVDRDAFRRSLEHRNGPPPRSSGN